MVFGVVRTAFFQLILLMILARAAAAETFRVVTYNVENYLEQPSGTRPAKPAAAQAKVREGILLAHPDVLALQEMGGTNMLFALQSSLKTNGLDLPFWEHITGYDTNIHLAILSHFPIISRHPHTNEPITINGHRFIASRGFAEVEIQVNSNFTFTLIAAHLKSKRPIAVVDESELRLAEAKILRQKIDDCLAADPKVKLVVLGDLNDSHDSPAVKTIIGKGKKGLMDTRPAERNGDGETSATRRLAERKITWTHFYNKEDSYSRIDYILLNRNMEHVWDPHETFIPTVPDWGLASDHRPLVATFRLPAE